MNTTKMIAPTKFKAHLLAARPKTLFASIGPVLLGTALAYFEFDIFLLDIFIVTLLSALFLQFSTNLINDYYDSKKGTDNEERLGPDRVTQKGFLTPYEVKRAFVCTMLIALFLGLYLMILGGWPIILIGFSSLFFAYAYTGGPYPLSYHGLGEISAYLYFGPIAVMGTHYLQSHVFTYPTFIIGSGVGFISALILAINNLRDIKSDTGAKKRTIAVRFGEKFQRKLCLVLLVLANLSIVLFAYTLDRPILLLGLLTCLPFIGTWIYLQKGEIGRILNDKLANTGKYLFLYSLAIAIILVYKK